MKTVKLFFILALSLTLALVVVQNYTPIQARFLWFTAEVPVIVLLFLTAAGGFVLGLLVSIFMKSDAKSEKDGRIL